MVFAQKTFVQKGIDIEISTISLTLQKGFGVRSSGIPLALIKDQFDRAKILLDQIGLRLKSVRYVFQASISANSASYVASEMAVVALLVDGLKGRLQNDTRDDIYIGSFNLNGRALALEYPEKYYVAALKRGAKHLILPETNIKQLPRSNEVILVGIRTLSDLLKFLETRNVRPLKDEPKKPSFDQEITPFFSQPMAARALDIAIIGRHHLLMFGRPGIGKTSIIQHYMKVLPALNKEQKKSLWPIEVKRNKLLSESIPVVYIHPKMSVNEIYGGGRQAFPGAISLAHHGIVVADELDHFSKLKLETLKMGLEEGEAVLDKNQNTARYPAVFTLIGSCNEDLRELSITQFSSSFLDRIDLIVQLHKPNLDEELCFFDPKEVRYRLDQAIGYRDEMKAKYSFESPIATYRNLPISKEGKSFIQKVIGSDKGSVRSLNRWIQTSFSMMFLDQNSHLTEEQLAEALSFKRLH